MKLPVQQEFSQYGYVVLAPGEEATTAQTTFPDTWHNTYFSNNFNSIDPIFSFALSNNRNSKAKLLSSQEMSSSLFEEAQLFGADSNFVCVSHYSGNHLIFGGVNKDLDSRKVAHCQSLCQKTHRLELSKKLRLLTDPQIELMEFSEEGLRDKEISLELGISLSAVAQRKKAICNAIGTDTFRATLQLYSMTKWGGISTEYT